MPASQAVIAPDRKSLLLTVQDGGVGDADLTADGVIDDPGAIALVPSTIPAFSEWGIILVAVLMALAASFTLRRA